MARTALVFALCALLAAAAAAADFASFEEPLAEGASDELQAPQEAQAEELRAGQEQTQQVQEQQSDLDAPQGKEQEQRSAAEQQSWQAEQSRQNPVWQGVNEGTAGRLQQGQQQGQWTGQQNQQTNQQPNQWQAQPGQQGQQFNCQCQPTNAVTQRPPNCDFGLQSGGGAGSQSWWPPAPPPTGQKQPPAGYTPLETFGWVKAYEKSRTWLEAASACWADGAQLAVAESEEEARALGAAYGRVKALVKGSEVKDLFFVGANDIAREGYFVTLHGTKFSPKTWLNNGQNRAHTWLKGEPNNYNKNDHCVVSNDKGYYLDGNCQSKFAFICQFKDRYQPTHRTGSLQQTEMPRKY